MITLTYKRISDLALQIDVYPPSADSSLPNDSSVVQARPAVLFFHGGGLTVGDRKSWFPSWMHRRFTDNGYLFISADYRLIPPATGHEIIEDIRDLWRFLNDPDLVFAFCPSPNGRASREFRLKAGCVAVAGVSAGGFAVWYGRGLFVGVRLDPADSVEDAKLTIPLHPSNQTPHYLHPKTQPFFRGRELLDPSDPALCPFVFPYPLDLSRTSTAYFPQTSDSPLSYNPLDHPTHPGYPANPRMLLARLYLQLGTYLDYYTGEHEPSLSARLREALDGCSVDKSGRKKANWEEFVDPWHHRLFPQFQLCQAKASGERSWPPTVLLHGTDDSAVPVEESRNLYALLTASRHGDGVEDLLIEVPCAEHSFDLLPDAEAKCAKLFERVVNFVHSAVVGESLKPQ